MSTRCVRLPDLVRSTLGCFVSEFRSLPRGDRSREDYPDNAVGGSTIRMAHISFFPRVSASRRVHASSRSVGNGETSAIEPETKPRFFSCSIRKPDMQ